MRSKVECTHLRISFLVLYSYISPSSVVMLSTGIVLNFLLHVDLAMQKKKTKGFFRSRQIHREVMFGVIVVFNVRREAFTIFDRYITYMLCDVRFSYFHPSERVGGDP